jgi:hypothetical protein
MIANIQYVFTKPSGKIILFFLNLLFYYGAGEIFPAGMDALSIKSFLLSNIVYTV